MNVSEYISREKKKPWVRRIAVDGPKGQPNFKLTPITQDQFLNEVCESAHTINMPIMSLRPVYGPTGVKDKNGKEKWDIVDYDEVEVTPVGMQEEIICKKISHFAADGFWTAAETDDEDRFNTLMSWADQVGVKTAFIDVVHSVFRTGDGAIYLYQTADPDTPIDYEVYGYERGDELFPQTDLDGKTIVARKYKFQKRNAVDIFTTKNVETWMAIDDDDDVNGLVPKKNRTKSEDGYVLVRRRDAQAGSGLCQCIYFRVDDIPTGVAQASIEKLENAKTYVGEHLKGSAMPILFLKAEKTTSLPPTKLANRALGVKGTTDALAHSDAKFLAPPDASNIATMHVGGLEDDIRSSCMSVKIDPEVIKQGSDSSATMKILYAPEVQWAQVAWKGFLKPVRQLMLVFKALVGKVEGDISGYSKMRISVGQNVWIPENSAEALKMELDQVYARTKSRKAAMVDIGNTHRGDYKQIDEEWEKELTMKAEAPAAAKAKYGVDGVGNDDEPKGNPGDVNNQAPGKSIQN